MISDGDSSAYDAVKHTYVNMLLKDLADSDSLDNRSSMDFIDENVNDISISQLSPEQYKSNFVNKEDCINHVKKRVWNHLKTLKSRYSGFEIARGENSTSATEKKKHVEVKNHIPSDSSAHSSSDDDVHTLVQPVSKGRRRRRLADGKPYGGGAGRMTKVMEHKLADCYGLAIRQSSQSAKSILIFC